MQPGPTGGGETDKKIAISISGTKVLLTLSSPVAYGDVITVTLTDGDNVTFRSPDRADVKGGHSGAFPFIPERIRGFNSPFPIVVKNGRLMRYRFWRKRKVGQR